MNRTLAKRPENSPVWVFGYGSLMWNPVFDADEICLATLNGWHRTFCLRLTSGRGTAAQPGRMLALEPGGRATGLAFRLPEVTMREELELLWKREMVTGCYRPQWCPLALQNGDTVTALVFVTEPEHPLVEKDTCIQHIAPLIASASGPLGTNAQYLFSLEKELKNYGMSDEELCELARQVRLLQRQRDAAQEEDAAREA